MFLVVPVMFLHVLVRVLLARIFLLVIKALSLRCLLCVMVASAAPSVLFAQPDARMFVLHAYAFMFDPFG